MKKIFKTSIAICLFITTMLIMNTFKAQGQSVEPSERAISIRPGESRDVSLDAGLGTEILAAEPIVDDNVLRVRTVARGPLKWIFNILGMIGDTTIELIFKVSVKHNDEVTEIEVGISVTISMGDTVLNVLQLKPPVSMFAIKQDELLELI